MKECNGSGSNPLCSTKSLHSHCECGEPLLNNEPWCHWCDDEKKGIPIHNSEDYLRTTLDHTSDEFGYESDWHSAFNHLDTTPIGFIDLTLSMKKMDVLRWNSKQRAKAQRDEPLEDE